MKKVYIDAVLEKNLGDDLFLQILTDRYKNCLFYSQTKHNYKDLKKENLKIYSGAYVNLINGCMSKIFKNGKFFGKVLRKKCDCIVGIGGSIFTEWGKIDSIKKHFSIYDSEKPYYILGSNFGPYKTDEYKNFIKNKVLKNAEDVCFRDMYSYSNFKDLSNVRIAPDIVFSLDTENIDIKNKKEIVISVINCEKKISNDCQEKYENKIIQLIEMFYEKGYEITLMSFCKAEGDEKTIDSIVNKMERKPKTYFYNGNIDEALNVIGNCEIVVGTRFHANILGLIMNKTIIPISYSDKTINVLNDMNFKGKIFDIRDIDNLDASKLTDEDLKYKLDVKDLKKEAEKHFENLDKFLGKEPNE